MVMVNFSLPTYAKDMLWLTDGADFQQPTSGKGEVELPAGLTKLELHWGTPAGSLLTEWLAPAEEIQWNCEVHLNGHVEISHLVTVNDLELMIFEMTGRLLPPSIQQLPTLADLKAQPYNSRLTADVPEKTFWYSLIVPSDSAMTDFVTHALINGQAVDCYASLANHKSRLWEVVGLPLVLESMTLYGSR